VFFLILAACSQMLSIGLKDRELQVATGLGFYSLVSLSVTVWHSHQTTSQQYVALEGLVAATYVCSLLYWVYSFAQEEAKRREFSPQMQSMLLAVAGAARSSRIALGDSSSRPRKGRER
jgi:apolipoprotein N-acyltransferase